MPLFAQRNPDEAILLAALALYGAVILVAIVVQIFYTLSVYRVLNRCHPRNRTLEPGMVWLNLIPCVNLVIMFMIGNSVPQSIRYEFQARGLRGDNDFAKGVGQAYPILFLCGIIPLVGPVFSLAGLVCWIISWVRIAGYSSQLQRDGSPVEFGYDDDYEIDDTPRRSSPRSDRITDRRDEPRRRNTRDEDDDRD
jgi:hypothetical protein